MAVHHVHHELPIAQQSRIERGRVARVHPQRRSVDNHIGGGNGLGGSGVTAVLERAVAIGVGNGAVMVVGRGHAGRCLGHLPQLAHVALRLRLGFFHLAPQQQHLSRAGNGGSVVDGQGSGAGAAYGHPFSGKIHPCPLKIGYATLAVGVVSQQLFAERDEQVATAGQLRGRRLHIRLLKRQRLVGSGDVDGEELAGVKELGRLRSVGDIHEAVSPRQRQVTVQGIVHGRRFGVGHRMPQHVELLRFIVARCGHCGSFS